ncbi:MAG: fibronectin type III domain-containing protein [Firmicutes bacterium]|nr:fibronectin type III domain-containing protein [Bacillota bacterium]
MQKKSLILVLISLLLVGCSLHSPTITPKKTGQVVIQSTNLPLDINNQWTAYIILTRGKHQLEQVVPVASNSFTTTLSVPAGTWDISLQLLDEQGVINYQDTVKSVTIHPNQNHTLNFQLRPANGELRLMIDLSSYPNAQEILRVRVHFNDQVKELTRSDASEPFIGEYSLAPGSYDFKVELFTESFRVGDKVDPGIWQTIHIEPSSQQTITWQPLLKQLTITANILTIPEAPTNFYATKHQETVLLEWNPSPSDNVTEYNIYMKKSPFDPFELLATVPGDTTEYTHELTAETELPKSITYCIQSLSTGINGYRSDEIEIFLD